MIPHFLLQSAPISPLSFIFFSRGEVESRERKGIGVRGTNLDRGMEKEGKEAVARVSPKSLLISFKNLSGDSFIQWVSCFNEVYNFILFEKRSSQHLKGFSRHDLD